MMKSKRIRPRKNWHYITSLRVAITRAILQGDNRGLAVLENLLDEALNEPP